MWWEIQFYLMHVPIICLTVIKSFSFLSCMLFIICPGNGRWDFCFYFSAWDTILFCALLGIPDLMHKIRSSLWFVTKPIIYIALPCQSVTITNTLCFRYIRLIVVETLRLFPQPPLLIRRTLKSDSLPGIDPRQHHWWVKTFVRGMAVILHRGMAVIFTCSK